MAFRGDQSRAIDYKAIGLNLPRQAVEGVGFRLDFDAANVAVDHGDVDARGSVCQAKLFKHQGIVAPLGARQQLPQRRRTEIPVLQLCWYRHV
jgi:hypothetical protein